MKNRNFYIILIIILSIAVIYLGKELKKTQFSLERSFAADRAREFEHVTFIMSNSLQETLKLYKNDFSERELELFKVSLDNAIVALSMNRVKLDIIEWHYEGQHGENYNLSEAMLDFRNLMMAVQKNAKTIDEETYKHMASLVHTYGKQLWEKNYESASFQDFYKESTAIFEEMIQRILELTKLELPAAEEEEE